MKSHFQIALPDPIDAERVVEFPDPIGPEDRGHHFGELEIHAINAAIEAGRPLLVRGEPGIGKSQLARAAALELGRVLISHVVDSRTEARDLLWQFDAIKRLADAQIARAIEDTTRLAEENYVQPGPLWWAFEPHSAETQAGKCRIPPRTPPSGITWECGTVVLIDEIDKAESELPNGLLEVLGARQFTPRGWPGPVRMGRPAPLIVITSNEERGLPDAFVRRCFVLNLDLPEEEPSLRKLLIGRGHTHFPDASDPVLEEAARLLINDRNEAIFRKIRPKPGQAEYLDLLRAVLGQTSEIEPEEARLKQQMSLLKAVARYTLKKHPRSEDFAGT